MDRQKGRHPHSRQRDETKDEYSNEAGSPTPRLWAKGGRLEQTSENINERQIDAVLAPSFFSLGKCVSAPFKMERKGKWHKTRTHTTSTS